MLNLSPVAWSANIYSLICTRDSIIEANSCIFNCNKSITVIQALNSYILLQTKKKEEISW